jgi:hypothetical protein
MTARSHSKGAVWSAESPKSTRLRIHKYVNLIANSSTKFEWLSNRALPIFDLAAPGLGRQLDGVEAVFRRR